MTMKNLITDRDQLSPDQITDALYDFMFDHEVNETSTEYQETIDALYWIKAAAENPFNADYFRSLLDTLSTVAEIIRNEQSRQ